MAMAASTSLRISITFQCSRNNNAFFVDRPCSRTNLPFPRHRSSSSVLTFARRRSNDRRPAATSSNKKKQKKKDAEDDEDLDEDAFEALFRQLEEDLKNDNLSLDDDDDEITEEDLANLERELEEALKDDELSGDIESIVDGKIKNVAEEEEEEENEEDDNDEESDVAAAIKGDDEDDDDDEDEDEDQKPVILKNWQLKRLAYALKTGRRKTSIKNLAADVCLDRAVVLELLREPPPHLLLLSAALPDKPISTISEPPSIPMETVSLEKTTDTAETKTTVEMPVHVMQRNWAAKKRIKKRQLETLELVYRRSQRPTNAMVSSIVHVTNLPRKRVLKWFEDKRAEDGAPDHHIPKLPYRRSAAATETSPS